MSHLFQTRCVISICLLYQVVSFVLFLQWLRSGQTHAALGESFKLHRCRVQSIIADLWTPVMNVLQQHLIPKKPQDYRPSKRFDNHPHAIGAPDATLIRVTKPRSTVLSRDYLSGKHRACGVRLQVPVAPDGNCVHYGGRLKGGAMTWFHMNRAGLLLGF